MNIPTQAWFPAFMAFETGFHKTPTPCHPERSEGPMYFVAATA